jgi:hypothetical protein
MNEQQLKLFEEELPRLNDTEEALLHYMQLAMSLENELKEVKEQIKQLSSEMVVLAENVEASRVISLEPEDSWDNSWSPNDMITIHKVEE